MYYPILKDTSEKETIYFMLQFNGDTPKKVKAKESRFFQLQKEGKISPSVDLDKISHLDSSKIIATESVFIIREVVDNAVLYLILDVNTNKLVVADMDHLHRLKAKGYSFPNLPAQFSKGVRTLGDRYTKNFPLPLLRKTVTLEEQSVLGDIKQHRARPSETSSYYTRHQTKGHLNFLPPKRFMLVEELLGKHPASKYLFLQTILEFPEEDLFTFTKHKKNLKALNKIQLIAAIVRMEYAYQIEENPQKKEHLEERINDGAVLLKLKSSPFNEEHREQFLLDLTNLFLKENKVDLVVQTPRKVDPRKKDPHYDHRFRRDDHPEIQTPFKSSDRFFEKPLGEGNSLVFPTQKGPALQGEFLKDLVWRAEGKHVYLQSDDTWGMRKSKEVEDIEGSFLHQLRDIEYILVKETDKKVNYYIFTQNRDGKPASEAYVTEIVSQQQIDLILEHTSQEITKVVRPNNKVGYLYKRTDDPDIEAWTDKPGPFKAHLSPYRFGKDDQTLSMKFLFSGESKLILADQENPETVGTVFVTQIPWNLQVGVKTVPPSDYITVEDQEERVEDFKKKYYKEADPFTDSDSFQ